MCCSVEYKEEKHEPCFEPIINIEEYLKNRSKKQRYTIDEVKYIFTLCGCVCLEDVYIDNKTSLQYICKCGNIDNIIFKNFLIGPKVCKQCSIQNHILKLSLTHDFVKLEFEKNNCVLLDTYINSQIPLKYKCKNDHITYIRFTDFRQGKRCKQCAGLVKHSQEYIDQYFISRGCECLDTYINNRIPMKYKCVCGNISRIRFDNFRKGQYCKQCSSLKLSGPGNPRWIEDRDSIRSAKELHVLSAKYKYQYRKLYPHIDKNIAVDHIFPIKAFVDYNIYDLDIINDFDNFQFLTAYENGSKGGKYSVRKFFKYLRSKGIETKKLKKRVNK